MTFSRKPALYQQVPGVMEENLKFFSARFILVFRMVSPLLLLLLFLLCIQMKKRSSLSCTEEVKPTLVLRLQPKCQ